MVRLEQVMAIVLAAALAIPSYWFFWTMAGGGGYERRHMPLKSYQDNYLWAESCWFTNKGTK